ncbi:TPA: hypothetical protein I7148_05370 [Vibrio vulnificus]|nr:hypothetical protein [Vibrio vulnificus]HAS8254045.1 hypothetical protein [Vibrio vulnificus]HAU8250717.1 hypothetical protein [Vibrio vulnificus]
MVCISVFLCRWIAPFKKKSKLNLVGRMLTRNRKRQGFGYRQEDDLVAQDEKSSKERRTL